MELKDYIKRYVRYGVVKDEWEFAEICSLTMEVARALYPYEFDKKLEVLEESSVEMLKRFNIGFCESCLSTLLDKILKRISTQIINRISSSIKKINCFFKPI